MKIDLFTYMDDRVQRTQSSERKRRRGEERPVMSPPVGQPLALAPKSPAALMNPNKFLRLSL